MIFGENKTKDQEEMQMYKEKLLKEYRYTDYAAEITAWDLCYLKSEEAREALRLWAEKSACTDIREGEYSAHGLMENHHMRYPAALIFLDWMKYDSRSAKEFINSLM